MREKTTAEADQCDAKTKQLSRLGRGRKDDRSKGRDADDSTQRSDAMRVRQVVTNLLSNAVANATESSIVLASITRENDEVRVTIYNEGRGIPPEEQSRLFLPFASLTERRIDSTGLGLYIAKQLVQAMGGTIGFDTQPGRNAAFWFTLKAATTPPPPGRPRPR